jgi:TPP-dependent pyruvate/acetoin dehydrogenase alpha subunit
VSLFRSQCLSRALDRTSRVMQRAGQGYYTIGSSGHEGLAAVAHALRPTDVACDARKQHGFFFLFVTLAIEAVGRKVQYPRR